jgi:type IV pilus assembly protein PilQ
MVNFGEFGMKGIRWLDKSIRHGITAAVGAGVLLQSITIQAATIEDISFAALPNEQFEIKLGFDGEAVEPKGYTVESPARIVLDFEGTESALAEKKYALSFDNGESAVVLSAGGRTRMIVNLKTPVPYEVAVSGGSLTLLVGNKASVGTAGESSGSQVSSSGASSTGTIAIRQTENTVEDVDFSRGEAGQGIVSIALANAATPIDVSREGSSVVLSFYHTALPEALDRKLDVIDFATPIKTIDSSSNGATTRVVIETVGEYDYLAYQADGQYVVSVQPLTKEALAEQRSKFEFTGEKLSLNFQDIEVRSVLQLIADFTGLNLVASDTVTGSITLRLENVPWDQALEIVLKSKGLDKRQQGNVLMVAPAVEIAEQERLQVEANKQLIELAPLVTDFVRVRYADARELFDLFDVDEGGSGGGGSNDENATSSILSERGTAIVDERTNTIVLTDVQEKIEEFRRLVQELDIPIRQVEIDARIIVATTDFRKEIGMRWGIAGLRDRGDTLYTFAGNRNAQQNPDGVIDAFGGGGDMTLDDTLAVDLGAAERFGSLSLGLLKDNTFIDWELSAMESDGFGEIISQPKVLTGDKQEAIIKSGTEIPYETGTSSGETDLEFREAVLQLKVTPQITPDNRVIMDLHITQDQVGEIVPTSEGGSEPTIDVTEVMTQALVGDGQTLVLGGIFQMEEIKAVDKVPVLGDIPFVGRLFRNNFNDRSKREILIFVTPRIIKDSLLDQ